MRIPIPKNELVAFTLAGAFLTAVVAGGLAFPIPGVTQTSDASASEGGTAATEIPQATGDAPTPNPDFTPAVQTQSGYEDEEHEEYEEGKEHDDDEEGDGHEEYDGEEDDG